MPTNRRIVTKEQDDLYPTPSWATQALLELESFEGEIWEPACGDGSMSEVLKTTNTVVSTDLYDHGYSDLSEQLNFVEDQPDRRADNVVTNPPYNVADRFVFRGLQAARRKVAYLLRLAYLEGQERHELIYSQTPPNRVYVFSERITFYKKGATKKGSGTTAYAWFVWDVEHPATTTEIKWIPPRKKRKKK